jgi:hypothetical protein
MVIGEAVILERKGGGHCSGIIGPHGSARMRWGKKKKRREEERIRVGYLCSMSLLVLEHVNCIGRGQTGNQCANGNRV